VKEHSAAILRRQWRESSDHLGEYLWQIHSATFDGGVLDNQEVLDELARLKRGGIVIGLTLSGANQAEVLARARRIDRDAAVRLCAGHMESARTVCWPGSGRGPGRRHGYHRQRGPGQRHIDQPQCGCTADP
jgi:hypothetical protein